MNLDPLRIWWAEAKLYVFGALVLGLAVAFWWRGHSSYHAGKAAGDQEVAALKAQYQQAYTDAQAQTRAAQQAADAQALADAKAHAQAAQAQAQAAQATASKASDSAAKYQAALEWERKHDATVDAWLNTVPPRGVRQPAGPSSSG